MATYSPQNDCTTGILMDTVCHLQSFTKAHGIIMFGELDEDDQQMIPLCIKLSSASFVSVCEHHFAQYITCFGEFHVN